MIKAYFIGGTLDQSTKILEDYTPEVHALKTSERYASPSMQEMHEASAIVPAETEKYINVGIQARNINLEINIYILEEYLINA